VNRRLIFETTAEIRGVRVRSAAITLQLSGMVRDGGLETTAEISGVRVRSATRTLQLGGMVRDSRLETAAPLTTLIRQARTQQGYLVTGKSRAAVTIKTVMQSIADHVHSGKEGRTTVKDAPR
jgi:hypothetical protein